MCSKPQVSSHFTPNRTFLDRFPNSERFDVEYKTTMECVALDDLDISENDFIKIDVQGGEAETIQGMKRVLLDNPRILILWELSPEQMSKFGYDPLEFLKYLKSLGFYSSTLDEEAGEVIPREPEEILANCPKRSYVNVISKRWF